MSWKLFAMGLVVSVAVPATAHASGRGAFGPHTRYDASLDFSKQFDEEVKYEREHPRDEDSGDWEQPARHRRHSHSHSRRSRRHAEYEEL